jgi:hypothetical protein
MDTLRDRRLPFHSPSPPFCRSKARTPPLCNRAFSFKAQIKSSPIQAFKKTDVVSGQFLQMLIL